MEWRQLASRPVCRKEAVVRGENYRITILTPRLFRLEYSEDGVFEDRPTQCVLNREFPVPQFQVFETDVRSRTMRERLRPPGLLRKRAKRCEKRCAR